MRNPTSPSPLSPPAYRVDPRVRSLDAARCASPQTLQRRLGEGRGVRCLFESAGPDRGAAHRSIVVTRAPLRLELRGEAVEVRCLESAGLPLLASLAERLDGARLRQGVLTAPLPRTEGNADAPDHERLRGPSPLDPLRTFAALIQDARPAPLSAGAFGALAYGMVDRFETLPPRRPDPLEGPDAAFVLATDAVLFDHRAGRVHVVTRPLPSESEGSAVRRHQATLEALAPSPEPAGPEPRCPAPDPLEAESDLDDAAFLEGVERLRGAIEAGEVYQAVLSRGFRVISPVDPLDVYAELAAHNPSPYQFFLDLGGLRLIGASPETFLRVADGCAELRPIAGTVPRGRTADGALDADTDRRLALQLLLDDKECAEHAMLLDLARNDVARVSQPGTTEVVEQLAVEGYSHVQHLVSRVRGRLQPDLDALHAYRAVANMGTLTGAPKPRAMELIRELEAQARGFYGGAVGYLLADGQMDTCIAIRTLVERDGAYHTRAGAGVVWDSDPRRELAEVGHKAQACLEALARAQARCAVEVSL